MKHLLMPFALLIVAAKADAQSVGIGTNTPDPTALLHVSLGTNYSKGVLITGLRDNTATVPNLGAGVRLMFYPGKAAFRVGEVSGTQWDNALTGSRSVAMGLNTTASGDASVAFGANTVASGNNAAAVGSNSTASGFSSMAVGSSTSASATNSIALGSSTTASGSYSVAMGYASSATGYNSFVMGFSSKAMGLSSAAIGLGVNAKAYSAVSIGAFNDDSDDPLSEAADPMDRIFQIGNGSSNTVRSNAITVLRNGNVGVGAIDPAYRLDARGRMRIRSGGTAPTSAGIWLNRNDNSNLAGFLGVDANNDLGIFTSANGSWSLLVHNTTGNVTVKGTVTANGVTLTSDERLKKDITPLGDVMPLLEKLHGYQYHWKDETEDAALQTGLLAQEVEMVMPELVKTDDKGMKSVNYMGLIPYLLEAAKKQESTIASQQQQIDTLKQMVLDLSKK